MASINALAALGSTRACDGIAEVGTSDKSALVMSAAASALHTLGDPRRSDVLAAMATNQLSGGRRAKRWAIEQLLETHDPRAAHVLEVEIGRASGLRKYRLERQLRRVLNQS